MKVSGWAVCAFVIASAGCSAERKHQQQPSRSTAFPAPASPETSGQFSNIGGITNVPGRPGAPETGVQLTPPPTATSAVAVALDSPESRSLPSDVIAQVNGHKLTLAEALKEADILMAGRGQGSSPQQPDRMRQAVLKTVVERFVANTLLLGEADRLGITLTPQDEANAAAGLQAMLPPGVTAEEAMRKSPLGAAKFREEMLATARIKKLLRAAKTPETNIPEADYVSFTNQFRSEIEKSESVRARHILVATKPDDSAAEKDRKRQFADSIRTQLLAGADFAMLAKAHSDCPSKNMGGDLGRFGRRKMVKPFSDAAFSQHVDAIGDVVETQFGFHVIQVTERKAMEKEDLLDMLRRRRLLERLAKAADIKFSPALGAESQGQGQKNATQRPPM